MCGYILNFLFKVFFAYLKFIFHLNQECQLSVVSCQCTKKLLGAGTRPDQTRHISGPELGETELVVADMKYNILYGVNVSHNYHNSHLSHLFQNVQEKF